MKKHQKILLFISTFLWAVSYGVVISVYFQNQMTEEIMSGYSVVLLILTAIITSEKFTDKLTKIKKVKAFIVKSYTLQIMLFLFAFCFYCVLKNATYYFYIVSISYYPLSYMNYNFFKMQLNRKYNNDELTKINTKIDNIAIKGQLFGYMFVFILNKFDIKISIFTAVLIFIISFFIDLYNDLKILDIK